MQKITLPMSDEVVRSLKVGDPVALSGVMITGRDTAHKWMYDTFIKKTRQPQGDDLEVYAAIKPLLNGSLIYHCGPVVSGLDMKQYKFVAAGPTTSSREEPYQGDVMRHFNMKGAIGKGGMFAKTLAACQEVPGLYLHTIGGAAPLIAQTVTRVLGVYKYDFGVPEAMWVIEVQDFPAVVTMDSHGKSLHEGIAQHSKAVLDELLAKSQETLRDSVFLSPMPMNWRKRVNYTIRHTVPGGWCGLIAVGFLVSLFLLFLRVADIPICTGLPPACWWVIFPLLILAGLFWIGMFGHFPTEYITEDEEEKAPLSETPQVEKIYDPKSGLPELPGDDQDEQKPERF